MRFNRVLLLAASINLAVLATVFTLSCSGDKGSSGKDGTKCSVQGSNFVCDDGTSVDLSGFGGGDANCHVEGKIYMCDDGTRIDFGVQGCEVSEFMGQSELAQVDCGSGNVFGLCHGIAMDFDTEYCSPSGPLALPSCAGAEYSPSKGQACVGGVITNCPEVADHYWPDRSNSYDRCSLDPKYAPCLGNGDTLVGVFYVGRGVSNESTTDIEEGEKTEFQGTQYCKDAGTKDAKIATCLAERGEGYIPDQDADFNDCKLKANYRACVSRTNIEVGAFNITSHICENQGSSTAATVAVKSCLSIKGFPQYTPIIVDGYYKECDLNKKYGECFDNTNTIVDVYLKTSEICKDYGRSNAKVDKCSGGLIPEIGTDGVSRECKQGKEMCANRLEETGHGYWDEAIGDCFFSERAACYSGNKNASGTQKLGTCQFNGEKWKYTLTTGGPEYDCVDGNSYSIGRWDETSESDAYFADGECYPSAKAWCSESKTGLWMLPNKNNAAEANCKPVNTLNEYECSQNDEFFWGSLPTLNLSSTNYGSDYCEISATRAKSKCEDNGLIAGLHEYGWDKAAGKCKLLRSNGVAGYSYFGTAIDCEDNGGYHFDDDSDMCYFKENEVVVGGGGGGGGDCNEATGENCTQVECNEMDGFKWEDAACVEDNGGGECAEEDKVGMCMVSTPKTWDEKGNCDDDDWVMDSDAAGKCTVSGAANTATAADNRGNCDKLDDWVMDSNAAGKCTVGGTANTPMAADEKGDCDEDDWVMDSDAAGKCTVDGAANTPKTWDEKGNCTEDDWVMDSDAAGKCTVSGAANTVTAADNKGNCDKLDDWVMDSNAAGKCTVGGTANTPMAADEKGDCDKLDDWVMDSNAAGTCSIKTEVDEADRSTCKAPATWALECPAS